MAAMNPSFWQSSWNEWILGGTEFVREEDRSENKSPGLKRMASERLKQRD